MRLFRVYFGPLIMPMLFLKTTCVMPEIDFCFVVVLEKWSHNRDYKMHKEE